MWKSGKSLVAILAATAMLTLSACGNTPTGGTDETATDTAQETVTASDNSSSDEASSDTSVSDDTSQEEKTDSAEEEQIPALRDCVEQKMGCRIGCALTGKEPWDIPLWNIVTTHFNAVTLGNELKPDSLFGYSNGVCPGTTEAELNGETITVPIIKYDNPEKSLNKFVKWNEVHPDREIKIRGHVLVWHSQTPEWFFHEDYDKSKPYVDKVTMNKRLEWYICTVLTHFTGEDSEWKGMFYGWDVVNEAISDATCSYRSDNENPNEKLSEDRHGSNSSWWHVYESNEFIINAFKYANKYAPADLELYYNDYNDSNLDKTQGIVKLLQAVKDEEGEPSVGTRISAMGMQGHYGMENPSYNNIEAAIKSYCKVVGHVQMTEVDISASSDYTGDASQKDEENEKLKKRYNMINFAITAAMKKEEVNFDGITFWGTVDHYSWLQSRSNVGGGNTTGLPQMPLLFDENYEPKPCFYVFAK